MENGNYLNRRAYRVDEFCEAFRISRTTFYEELKKEAITIFKVGKRTLVSVEAAEAWINTKQAA